MNTITPQPVQDTLPRRVFAALFAVSATGAIGLTGMQSVLPAIGREIGVPDVMIVTIFALSALLWAITSPHWAKEADRRGQKPMIVLGETALCVSMLLCGAAVLAGIHHWIGAITVFISLLLFRGLFGLFGAASQPATQAFVAQRTSRAQRTRAVSVLAGASGLGTIIGPAAAPMFVLPYVGLAGPMLAFACVGLAMIFIASRILPHTPPQQPAFDAAPELALPPGSPKRLWLDRRLSPFLVFGFVAMSCQSMLGQVLGFMIIDRMKLPPMQAQGFTAVAMMAGATGALLAQWGLIPTFRLLPRQLMRIGPAVAAAGSLLIGFAPTYPLVVAGYALISIGFGLLRPGFTAGASLSVLPSEQARAAGALASATGVTNMLAPVCGILLYHWVQPAPYVLAALMLGALLAFALRHPTLTQMPRSLDRERV
jgi:MFS family permease